MGSVKEVAESAVYQQWQRSQSTGNSSRNCAREGIDVAYVQKLVQCMPIESQLLFVLVEVLHAVRYVQSQLTHFW